MYKLASASLKKIFFLCSSFFILNTAVKAQNEKASPELTEFYTPVPPIITPGKTDAQPPSDALILFDGKNLDQWRAEGNDTTKAAGWNVHDGIVTVDKKAAGMVTRRSFTDYQLHIEYRIPKEITGSGQARGNSGIFLASIGNNGDQGYELQVLDSYNNKTYTNGQAGSIYKQGVPLANPCREPGEWQDYNVIWTAPRFNNDGILVSRARVTVFLNGVLVQNNFVLSGPTLYVGIPHYTQHGPAPIKLQAHGDKSEPISYRNIWIRPL